MPSGKMNERERAICARVREFRESLKWTKAVFAQSLGVTRDQLASIEYARTPLRYGVGLILCKKFRLNPRWLVKGEGARAADVTPQWPEGSKSPPESALFSEVYDANPNAFKLLFKGGHWQFEPTPGFDGMEFLMRAVLSWFDGNEFADKRAEEIFARAVDDFAWNSLRNLKSSMASLSAQITTQTFLLTPASSDASVPLVKSQLDSLLVKLNRLTRERGAKSELAEFIGAPLASVSRWLAGERVPDGPNTLKLLQWAKKQERK